MCRTFELGTKVRLSFSGGPHAPNTADGMEVLFQKSLKILSITSLDPETVQLPASFILSAMFTGVCGPPGKLSLALVLHYFYCFLMLTLS